MELVLFLLISCTLSLNPSKYLKQTQNECLDYNCLGIKHNLRHPVNKMVVGKSNFNVGGDGEGFILKIIMDTCYSISMSYIWIGTNYSNIPKSSYGGFNPYQYPYHCNNLDINQNICVLDIPSPFECSKIIY